MERPFSDGLVIADWAYHALLCVVLFDFIYDAKEQRLVQWILAEVTAMDSHQLDSCCRPCKSLVTSGRASG